jgi:LPXTG-site transpeptidase (sortase) family protein
LLAGAGAALLLLGIGTWIVQSDDSGAGAGPGQARRAAGSIASSASPSATPPAPVPAKPARKRAGSPREISIPALDVEAPVVPIKAAGGVLVPPGDPATLGWWAAGARPGDRRGSALLTGHTVHDGGGALDDLEQVAVGDEVTVTVASGPIRYVVSSVRTFSKGSLADHAQRLFSQEVRGRLVLVTCEDWDGSAYLSNVVVVATPVT